MREYFCGQIGPCGRIVAKVQDNRWHGDEDKVVRALHHSISHARVSVARLLRGALDVLGGVPVE